MIARPLDLASKLQTPPRSLDALFFVNVGLLGLFFVLFGSRFVLAPGFGVDFRLPTSPGAAAHARPVTDAISVANPGQIITADGLCKREDLPAWLERQARRTKEPVLLVRASHDVPLEMTVEIVSMATAAGFAGVQMAVDEPAGRLSQGGR